MRVYKNLIEPFLISAGIDHYQLVLDFAASQGITLPSSAQQQEDRDMLQAYRESGAWDKDDVFCKFKGTATSDFKLICWKRLVKMQAVGGLNWTTNGVEGNGTTGYINTLYVPSLHANKQTLNNAGYGYVGTKNPAGTVATVHAQGVNNHDVAIIPNRGAGQNNYYQVNAQGVSGTSATVLSKIGLNAVYRDTNARVMVHTDTSTQINTTSTGLPDVNVHLLASNPRNGAPALFSTENLQYFFAGAAKTAEHDSLRTILI